jgi:tRNA-modifying protein YgfZ
MATQAPPQLQSEYRVLRDGAGILERGDRATLDVVGPDAVDFLQGQVTNDVAALVAGEGCYATILNPKGRILADLRILRRGEQDLWLDTDRTCAQAVLSNLRMYKIGRQVEVADRSAERAVLSLIGPAARDLAGADLPPREHSFVDAEIGGIAAIAVATDVGVDLLVDAPATTDLVSTLTERGAVPVSRPAAEIVRIESGRARYGADMSEDNLPGEIGLEERAVSFTKGCYVGQEPVARMHHRGHPNRHLRGLRLSAPAEPGAALTAEGREVGAVTSAVVSPALGPIALGIVRREVEPGAEVEVGPAGAPARVTELPFGDA